MASRSSWELPPGWRWARLTEIARVNPVYQLDQKVTARGLFPFLAMAQVQEGGGVVEEFKWRPAEEITSGKTRFRAGDTLFAKITPCTENGKVAFVEELPTPVGFGSTEFHVISPESQVSPKFLHYFARTESFRDRAVASMTGTSGRQRVPTAFFGTLEIPLPPLSEQDSIVAKVDRIEGVIQAQRAGIEKTKALLRAALAQVFDVRDGLLEGWKWLEFGDLIVWGPQNGLYKHSSYYGDGTPIVRIDSFYEGRIVDFAGLKRLRLSDDETEAYRLQENDVLLNRVNSIEYVGKSALVRGLGEDTVFESNMMRFRVDEGRVLPEFVIAFLCSQSAREQILKRVHLAINQVSINQKDVRSFRIPVPSLPTQRQIVQKVDRIQQALLAQEDNLGKTEALMQSALHRAFRGRL